MFWAILAVLVLLVFLNLQLLTRLQAGTAAESRLREDLARLAQRQSDDSRALREEVANGIHRFSTQSLEAAHTQRTDLDRIRESLDVRLAALQTDNARRLEEMRATVDENLQCTLETRLGDSFRLVIERLEQVHRGLGE